MVEWLQSKCAIGSGPAEIAEVIEALRDAQRDGADAGMWHAAIRLCAACAVCCVLCATPDVTDAAAPGRARPCVRPAGSA